MGSRVERIFFNDWSSSSRRTVEYGTRGAKESSIPKQGPIPNRVNSQTGFNLFPPGDFRHSSHSMELEAVDCLQIPLLYQLEGTDYQPQVLDGRILLLRDLKVM